MLRDRTLALIATVLIAVQATHIFQSKLATYDIWCFFLFVTAAWQLHSHSVTKRHLSLQMISGSLLFALAVLSKYVVIVYAPVFLLLLWLSCSRGSAVLFAILQALVLGIYTLQNAADLQILFNNQLAGQHLKNSTVSQRCFSRPWLQQALLCCGARVRRRGGCWQVPHYWYCSRFSRCTRLVPWKTPIRIRMRYWRD